ncbi:MAG TPA: aminomethyltransferase beta-barrel domain-containing protein [Luteolibacter sp.]|nr:aminomethyltransferase beta-barrel domain-containing protein [Luteolibacter sp.]
MGKDLARNRLIVGWDRPGEGSLYVSQCVVGTLNSLNEPIESLRRVEAQPRYRSKAEPAAVEALDDGRVRLDFHRPQRAIAPGQICAFYDGGRLLGGGVFESVA